MVRGVPTAALVHETTAVGQLYYGAVHFAVPIIVLLAQYVFRPQSDRHWRSIMGWLLVLALIGVA